jgi:hypothetical protein
MSTRAQGGTTGQLYHLTAEQAGHLGLSTSISETGGPTNLTVGAVADGQVLKRSGTTVVGSTPLTAGRLVARTIYTSGSASTHTFTAGIGAVEIFGVAKGGGGGGATFSSPNMSFGSGGAAGGEFKVRIVGTFTTSTYTVGAAGGGGGSNSGGDGSAGSDAVVVCNSVTYTAKGGLGGKGSTAGTGLIAKPGGAGVAGTNGDISSPGACGQPSIRLSGVLGVSGAGAPGPFGGGGAGQSTNGAGISTNAPGAGGGGAAAVSASQSGGNGGPGFIIYDEYSA